MSSDSIRGLCRGAAVFASLAAVGLPAVGSPVIRTIGVTIRRYEPDTSFTVNCWAREGLSDGEGAVYVLLEHSCADTVGDLEPLMADGSIPPGIVITLPPGTAFSHDGQCKRWMRAVEFDQPGPSFASAVAEEIVPAAEAALGVKASASPDMHVIVGGSSGGFAAFNACWYRNDYFRRCFCSSPTFSNIRGGNHLMPLVRKSEGRPIRTWMSVGTCEPDHFFGDSHYVALDAASALTFAGYDMHFDRIAGGGHCARLWEREYKRMGMSWLFRGWRTSPVVTPAGSQRVRDLVVSNGWQTSGFRMPEPMRTCRSTDGWRLYAVDPTNRFVMSCRLLPDGRHDQSVRLAPLELPWNVSRPGGFALAHLEDDRLLVATEAGVQGVVAFGIADLVLPLPEDLPCDNVAVVGQTLYASCGKRVFSRKLKKAAADPSVLRPPATRGYDDGFDYSREHEGETWK